jgi:hypothetical protein
MLLCCAPSHAETQQLLRRQGPEHRVRAQRAAHDGGRDRAWRVSLRHRRPRAHDRRELFARFASGPEWRAYPAGTVFEIAGKSGFDVRAAEPSAYLCEFL